MHSVQATRGGFAYLMSKREDINRGAILATVVAAAVIGLVTGNLWASILSGVVLYFILTWLRIIRNGGQTTRSTHTARRSRARRR